jgi:hypothetical protein
VHDELPDGHKLRDQTVIPIRVEYFRLIRLRNFGMQAVFLRRAIVDETTVRAITPPRPYCTGNVHVNDLRGYS